MSRTSDRVTPQAAIDDCWNTIGVYGDSSCPKLIRHIHCRNCPVYSAAAATLLDAEPPPGYLDRWTQQVAQKKMVIELDTQSVLVFRIAAEWLALPAALLQEIASLRPIHSIPHRRDAALLGVANIRGELLICIALRHLLGIAQAVDRMPEQDRTVNKRLLVLRREGSRAVCPVDEVHGLHRYHPRELAPVPATLARSTATYTQAVLTWREKPVGLLDDQLLFHTVSRSLA